MRKRFGTSRFAVGIACGLAIGGATFAFAQTPNPTGELIGTPAGVISAYGGTEAPQGWLIADGSEVSKTAYPDLYQVIGDRYGTASTPTTFRLPDLRGRVIVGRGTHGDVNELSDNDGLAAGSRKPKHRHGKGTLSTNTTGQHDHGVSVFADDTGRAHCACYGAEGTDGWTGIGTYYTGGAGNHSHTISGEVGDSSGPLDGPAYQTLNHIIKY